MIKIGIDVGSTTAKIAVLAEDGRLIFSKYERHNAQACQLVLAFLQELQGQAGDVEASLRMSGSVGMGLSEQYGLPFVQEVVAAAKVIQRRYPHVKSMIDIGGEDAKVVFFKQGEASDLRMNGNCAGGTGAFIDQMAVILGVSVDELDELASHATQVYPIASRCGVFCKTDIQNLIAKNVPREDIAASIFHAVAVQTVVTLAHGCDIEAPVLFCGGPLTFIPALRKAFADYLSLRDDDMVFPANGTLFPALGAALCKADNEVVAPISSLRARLSGEPLAEAKRGMGLPPVFSNAEDYRLWQERMLRKKVRMAALKPGRQEVFVGIDSGSTTTKIVVLDREGSLLYSFYRQNGGNPVQAVADGLAQLKQRCADCGADLRVAGSCSTGYGEDLVRVAFQLHSGIIETIAHYMAARHLDEDVSFILDIGGQDMKAIFVDKGVISRIEINEACSSGCGSFIETFAKTLGYTAHEFSQAACRSQAPCDLGTRCTVFMNSKVKQVLREGASIDDIAAGLAYSVVKNCLYKVLKMKDVSALGKHVVVQGGTMRNDAVVRAIELLTGAEVSRCDVPELMGAYGCALYAMAHQGEPLTLEQMTAQAHYASATLHCKGCDNHCLVVRYRFGNGRQYYSGNRCEKVFTNDGASRQKGRNAYQEKYGLLFNRAAEPEVSRLSIGMPRCLNMYEEYPFWHALFTACGIKVVLSDASDFGGYEQCARMVMSDNICFPAKLVHSHIENLASKKVDRIFMPFVVYEMAGKEQNSYNCPVVTGYSEVVRSVQSGGIPLDSPSISFRDKDLLRRQCREYLQGLQVDGAVADAAFAKALEAEQGYMRDLVACNEAILRQAQEEGMFAVMLAGRPYHTDPLIQHQVSDLLAGMGIHVVTDDYVRNKDIEVDDVHFLSQWTFPNRILKAAKWCAQAGRNVQFVQMTSFGCGPDAFLVDEVRDLLARYGKSLTLLKLDDINNVGSMKLRVRSLVESLRLADGHETSPAAVKPFVTTPVYDKAYRGRKIIVPFFTPFLSPLIPAVMRVAGYDVDNLPLSDVASCDWGLKYANNEVCYPATLIVGDVIKAFKDGKYDPSKTVVVMTQTGGQCRASNYIPLIKKALVDAGYTDVPVVSMSFGSAIANEQPAFKVNWLKLLPIALRAILYSDCISKFYYASVVREKEPGQAARLRDLYLKTGETLILEHRSSDLESYLKLAAKEFDEICTDVSRPKVGVVGEIFLKFNPFAQRNIIDWLIAHNVEVMPPVLLDFFTQSFVNRKARTDSFLQRRSMPEFVYNFLYKAVKKQIDRVNGIGSAFRYFEPFNDIFEEAGHATEVTNLNAQFGEGWLLPAEIVSYARHGVNNVISLQPFGCIANHIISKGIEKRLKSAYPDLNLLSLDFDSGVSDVNITNRALLFIDKLR